MGPRERTRDEWYTFARLQTWPAKEFGHSFSSTDELDDNPSQPDGSNIDLSTISHSEQQPMEAESIRHSKSPGDDATDNDSDSSSSQMEGDDEAAMYSASSADDVSSDGSDPQSSIQSTHCRPSLFSVDSSKSHNSDFGGFTRWQTSHAGSDTARQLAMQWLFRCQNIEDK